MSDPSPEQPLGAVVDAHPAARPQRVTLKGRWITLAPLDAMKHAVSLSDGSNGEPERERVWPARKAAFDRWLGRDNFDGEGRQQESLSSPRERGGA